MQKFPITIKNEGDITKSLLEDLITRYVFSQVKAEGKFLKAEYTFSGDVSLVIHDGRLAPSDVSLEFQRQKVRKKVLEE